MKKGLLLLTILTFAFWSVTAASAATITGTVYQSDGVTPITGWVAVDVFEGDPCGHHNYVTGVWTESESDIGTYVISDVPDGNFFLRISPWYSNYISEFWAGDFSSKDCRDAQMINITAGGSYAGYDFQLEAGGILTGTLTDEDGTAITGVSLQVVVYGGDPCVWIDHISDGWSNPENGTFTVSGIPAGTYFLRVWSGDTNYVGAWWTGSGGSHNCWEAELFTVDSGETTSGYDFQLETGEYISGMVQDDQGNPITGEPVDVALIQGDPCGGHHYFMGILSDPADGTFALGPIPPGEYFLRTYPADSHYISKWWNAAGGSPYCDEAQSITVFPDFTLEDVTFTVVAGGYVEGTVVDADHSPIANLWMEAFTGQCWDNWVGGAMTDGDGFYSIGPLPTGDVYVRTCAGCNNTNYLDLWYTETGGTANCDLAEPVTVFGLSNTGPIDFTLERGPWLDIDGDGDVDGEDLASLAQMIEDGLIDDIDQAVAQFAENFGRL